MKSGRTGISISFVLMMKTKEKKKHFAKNNVILKQKWQEYEIKGFGVWKKSRITFRSINLIHISVEMKDIPQHQTIFHNIKKSVVSVIAFVHLLAQIVHVLH